MSAKSNKSSKSPKKGDAIDRPFDPAIVKRAGQIAGEYRIILEVDDDVGYVGHALELPGALGDGTTPNRCVDSVREAVVSLVAFMLEQGQTPPAPSREAKRTSQINIRVTEEEKLRLEEAARRQGFRGVSDYVRNASLTSAD